MRMPSRKRALYLLLALCISATIYFYPFISSSITWMRHSHFRYENRTEIKLPFRWISGDGPGLHLIKPPAIISLKMIFLGSISSGWFQNTELAVDDSGPIFKPSDEGRARVFHVFHIINSIGTPDEPTYPFTSAGLLCSRVNESTTKPSDVLGILCFSSDSRYSVRVSGRQEEIREAGEIAQQIFR